MSKDVPQFTETKSVLQILDTGVGATPKKFLETVLNKLKFKDTIKIVNLGDDWMEDATAFDFANFSEQLAQHLPNCETLNLANIPVRHFRVESRTIKSLSILCLEMMDNEWEINCPNLVNLDLDHHSPPEKNFQRALINSPRIETYHCNKYWATSPLPALYLPNCTDFTHRRGDCTRCLELYLPRAKVVNLDSCFELEKVKLLTEGHPLHAEWNKPRGSELSKFRLSVANICSDGKLEKSLGKELGRVTNPSIFSEVENQMKAWMGMK